MSVDYPRFRVRVVGGKAAFLALQDKKKWKRQNASIWNVLFEMCINKHTNLIWIFAFLTLAPPSGSVKKTTLDTETLLPLLIKTS